MKTTAWKVFPLVESALGGLDSVLFRALSLAPGEKTLMRGRGFIAAMVHAPTGRPLFGLGLNRAMQTIILVHPEDEPKVSHLIRKRQVIDHYEGRLLTFLSKYGLIPTGIELSRVFKDRYKEV